ncbi:tail fiber domain-containing protein [Limosilactobacillus balticus]|uniref:tail fiber domain-containing protein n=1 Tax=Limosilactobacillus balticus TaxID=2759747 RepID=UPI0035BFB07B
MSKTNKQTVKVIVGEIGRDTKTGILGRGYSYDNGATFHVTDTMFGRLYDKDDGERMWPNMAHKVADEIKSATADLPNIRKQADEAVKFAESAIAASKVNSDAIIAQSSAVVEAKSAMDSATAKVQQLAANAASDVAQIESTIAEVQADVNQAKSANESAVQAVQAELKSTSDSMDKVEKRLNEVGTDLDTYAKSAAEQGNDITLIKQKQGQFEADFASAQGNVNQIQADIKGLRQNIKDNQGNIASLLTSADKLQASMTDAEKNITNLLLTASKYEQTFKDQDGRLSKVEQTATEHTSELADAKGNIDKVTQKADNLQLLLSDAQKNIQNIQLDAKGLHDTLTGQNNQLASLNVTLNNLDSKYSGITGDLQSKQISLSTEQQQTKDMLLRKADRSEVDSVKGTVNQVSAEQKTMADQINQKVSSVEYQTLKDKVNGMKVGTRNLLHNTSDQYRTLTGEGWMGVHTSSDEYTSVANYHNGNLFTYAATISNTSDVPVELQVWRCDQNKNRLTNGMLGISAYIYPGQKDVRVFLTGSIDSNTWYLQSAVYSSSGQSGQHTIQVKDERLVEGNVEGTWEANPTDTIASIQKNTTAIDENSKLISLMAKQTEVDNVKNTAQQISSRLDVLAGEVKSKVDETRVNNIVDGKGYATQSTVQSLITQKAGTINESITKLDSKIDESGGGINLQGGTVDCSLPIGSNGPRITIENYDDHTKMIHAVGSKSGFYIGYDKGRFIPEVGETYTFSADIKGKGTINGNLFKYEGADRSSMGSITLNNNWQRIKTTVHVSQLSGTWIIYPNPDNGNNDFYVKNIKIERGSIATPYSQAPSDNASVSQLQSVTASIDGLQSRVTNYQNDTSSKYTQLSSLMQSKVNQGDLSSVRTQLANAINDRVGKGELMSQINLQAGNTLIQSNKLYLDASSVVFSGRAFIPNAAISELDADKLTFYGNGSRATIGASVAQYDQDRVKSTINLQYNGGIEIHSSSQQGSILTMHDNTIRLASKSWGNNANPYQYSGFYAAPNYSLMNTYHKDGTTSGVAIDNDRIWIYGGSADQHSGSLQADVNWYSLNGKTGLLTGDQISLKAGNTQATLNDNNITINNVVDGNNNNYDVGIHIKGWAEMTGWFTCMGLSQTSLLSTKTRIEPLDTKEALDKIASADVRTYQFKSDVAQGKTKRHASVIIDDVHDVAEYYTPEEFISENRKGRDDGDIVGYLMGAVQELKKQLDLVKEKI